MPFELEDLTVNDGVLSEGDSKVFDIKMPLKWMKLRSLKIVQLRDGPMNVSFEIWEKGDGNYNPLDRAHAYLRVLRRTVIQSEEQGGEYHEILSPELLYHDRDSSYNVHCRMINNEGGTPSDFAIVLKCGEIGEVI